METELDKVWDSNQMAGGGDVFVFAIVPFHIPRRVFELVDSFAD